MSQGGCDAHTRAGKKSPPPASGSGRRALGSGLWGLVDSADDPPQGRFPFDLSWRGLRGKRDYTDGDPLLGLNGSSHGLGVTVWSPMRGRQVPVTDCKTTKTDGRAVGSLGFVLKEYA